MHELGIAESVIEKASATLSVHPGARLVRIGLRIGEWAGVDSDSLSFCFEALTKGTDWEGITLAIEQPVHSDALEFAYFELEEP